jgi:hypothetical protein
MRAFALTGIALVALFAASSHAQTHDDDDDRAFLEQSQKCADSAKRGIYCMPDHGSGTQSPTQLAPTPAGTGVNLIEFNKPGCTCLHSDSVAGREVCTEWQQLGEASCTAGPPPNYDDLKNKFKDIPAPAHTPLKPSPAIGNRG